MRLLLISVILFVGVVVLQSNRNHCYWHGLGQAVDWVDCLTRG